MQLQVVPVAEDRRREWWGVQSRVFAFEFKEEEEALFAAVQDWDRAWAATDGDQIVGSASSLTFTMTVPGGAEVPTAGLTAVAVLPTHRRGGALTAMIRRSFEDARDRGDPLAALLASESSIYGRFGYGVATHDCDLTLGRGDTVMRARPPATGRVRLMGVEEARSVVPGLQRAATSGRGIPGSIVRTGAMWDVYFHDPEHWRDGASALVFGVYEDGDGRPGGYVRYRLKENWDDALPNYRMTVGDLHAAGPEAYAALWSYCLGLDLVSTVKVYGRRVAEPVLELLADPRRVQRRLRDGLWVRLVDVPAALAARRYRVPGDLVIEVHDDVCPWAAGRFRLSGGPDGAECEPTGAGPDLRIGASDLASAYLGDERLGSQVWAGRVGGEPEAVERARLMFSWSEPAWSTVGF